jgi:hypothetical protein
MYIKVKRHNRPDCIVMLCQDRRTKKWCFVNLSTEHVCTCHFDTIDDAIADLNNRAEVASYALIENPFVYEQMVPLHGACLSNVVEKFRKNKNFMKRLLGTVEDEKQ